MAEVGLEEEDTYVLLCHKTISQYTENHTILELCLEAERHPGAQVA